MFTYSNTSQCFSLMGGVCSHWFTSTYIMYTMRNTQYNFLSFQCCLEIMLRMQSSCLFQVYNAFITCPLIHAYSLWGLKLGQWLKSCNDRKLTDQKKINLPRLTIIINFVEDDWKGRAVHVCHILGVTLPSSEWVFRMFAAITKLTTNHFTIWKLLILWITSTW